MPEKFYSELWANEPPNSAPTPLSRPRLSEMISDLLRKEWLEQDPEERCFDHDPTRMQQLVSFVEGKLAESEAEEVREHVLSCSRCRFTFSCLREAASAGPEPIPELLRRYLRTSGPVVFPNGEMGLQTWEFGLLNELPADTAERINEIVAERAWRRLRGAIPRRGIVVVCFSHAIHRIGRRLAAKMVEYGVKDAHVVMADGVFEPTLWCSPRELRGRYVIVFVDVVHTGSLLGRISKVCRQAEPREVVGMAVIDQSRGSVAEGPVYGLWTEPAEPRLQPQPTALPADVRYFDPVLGRAVSETDLPCELASRTQARATVERHLKSIAPIVEYVRETGALKQDARICGVRYPWALDLLCLLRHDQARLELAKHAKRRLADLAREGPWCLVYPAERFKRAGHWARVLSDLFGWPIVKVGSGRHYRRVTTSQSHELRKCSRVLIVDAAIRTGKTLHSLLEALRSSQEGGATKLRAFYAFDGLFQESRTQLERDLGIEILSLFRVPLGAPTQPVGQHCRERLRDTLSTLDQLPDGQHQATWVTVVREYCRKKLNEPRRAKTSAVQDLEVSLRRALEEGERGVRARLERSCHEPKPSLIKLLDVNYALQEPRTRNVLHGFVCNSMPSHFIEWCALALASQQDYVWFDKDWMLTHKDLFTNPKSERWEFTACISYWIRQTGNAQVVSTIRKAVEDFRRDEQLPSPSLFPEFFADIAKRDVFDARCETLLSVLSSSSE